MLIIILLIFVTKVIAKNYGIEYRPIEELNLKVDEIKKYRFYKESKISAYFIEDENPTFFEKKDDFYYSDYSEWSLNKPMLKKNREIKERDVYIYQKLKKIKKFLIEVFDEEETVLEFSLKINGFSVNTSSFCRTCSPNAYMYIQDESYNKAVKIDKMSIEMNDYYYPEEFKFKVMFNKEGVNYKITIYGDNENDILYENNYVSDLSLKYITIDGFTPYNAYEEEIIKYEETPNMKLKEQYKEYAYRDKYFLYEYMYKDYYPTYEEEVNGYIKDTNDFITEKKYSYLEQAFIKDKIVINNENYDLKDYIKTSLPFEVASNIDISKNGTYKVKYIFAGKTIEKDVQVKTNKEYIDDLERKLKQKDEEIKDVILNKDEIIERLESNIKSKDEIISKKKVEKSIEKQPILPVILITMGVMILIFCIIKSIKDNVELKK